MASTLELFVASLNWFDWVLCTLIIVSALYGLFRGFIKEAVTFTAWVLAIWVAYVYSPVLASYLEPYVETGSMRVALMVVFVFIAVLSSSSLIRKLLTTLIYKAGLAGLDSVLGSLFGLMRGGVLAMLLMILLSQLGFEKDQWWAQSIIVPKLSKVMKVIPNHLPVQARQFYEHLALSAG